MQATRVSRPFKILIVSDCRELYGKTLNTLRANLGMRFMLHPFHDFESTAWNIRTCADAYDLLVADSACFGSNFEAEEAFIRRTLSAVPSLLLLHKGQELEADRAIECGIQGLCFHEPHLRFRKLFPALALRMMVQYRELRDHCHPLKKFIEEPIMSVPAVVDDEIELEQARQRADTPAYA